MRVTQVLKFPGDRLSWQPDGRILLSLPHVPLSPAFWFPSSFSRGQQIPSLAQVLDCQLPVLPSGDMGHWTGGQADGSAGLHQSASGRGLPPREDKMFPADMSAATDSL